MFDLRSESNSLTIGYGERESQRQRVEASVRGLARS